MNHIYRLVWNPAKRVMQVASELAGGARGGSGGAVTRSPQRRPLALACALALGTALGVVPQFAAAQTVGASGGNASGTTGGTGSTGSNAGGNGNGSYGSGGNGGGTSGSGGGGGINDTHVNGGTSTGGGSGGGGYGYSAWTTGGAGGAGGGLSSAGYGGGGGGGAAEGGTGGGGGGGGSLGTTFSGTATASTSVTGGAGGSGSNGSGGGYIYSGGGGGGGGGGAGALLTASGSLTNNATITGGAGGNGGAGAGWGASGGGGGGGGAGLLMDTSGTLDNTGTIQGGNGGTGTQRSGGGGSGIYAAGNATINNHGTISGGLNGGVAGQYASAIQFNGTGNALNLFTGSTINGAVQLLDNSAATIASQDSGLTLGSNIVLGNGSNLSLDTSSAGLAVSGAINGQGNVAISGGNTLSLSTVNVAALAQNSGNALTLNGNVTTVGDQTYSGNVSLGADVTLASTGSGDISLASSLNNAHALTVSTGGNIGFGGSVALFALTTTSASFTATSDITTTGNLSIKATSGDINQTGGVFTVNGASSFDAGTNDITLNSANDFAGAVNLTGGNVQINDTNSLTLGTLATGDLTANSTGALSLGGGSVGGNLSATSNSGAINQSGALTVTGTSTLDAGSGSIALDNAGNDFVGTVGLTGNNVRVTDQNDLDVSALANSGSGDVRLIAGGTLTLSSGIATTGDITLASNGGTLAPAGNLSGNDVSLAGRDGLTLNGGVTATGTLDLASTDHAINQTGGVLTVTGTSTIDAGTGNITLGLANDFTGAVSLTGGATQVTDANALTLGALSTGALTATSTGALNLGSGNVAGNLIANSNSGAITQTGALTVTGASDIDAGAGNITLIYANEFVGAVGLTGNNVQIADANTLAFGTLDVGGTLAATSFGALNLGSGSIGGDLGATSNGYAIAQSGALTVTGISTLHANGGDITLTDADNDFVGMANLTGDNVQITDKNALAFGTLGIAGNLTATSTGALNLGSGHIDASLSANSNDGAITQTGALIVAGASSIDAGAGNITLTDAGDDFGGAVELTGNNVQIADANTLAFGTLGIAGNLSADSVGGLDLGGGSVGGWLDATSDTGAITQSAALTVTGGSAFTASPDNGTVNFDGTGAITLDNAGNDFIGEVTLVGGNTNITDRNDLDLGMATIRGDLTASSGGDLDFGESTGVGTTVEGTLTANSGGDIAQSNGIFAGTLTGSSVGTTTLTGTNSIAVLGDFSAAGFSLASTTPLTIAGTLDSSGDIHLDSGAITVTGAIDAGGTTTLGATTTLLFTGNATLGGDLVNDTNVTFDQGIDNRYAGRLSGSGALDKLGSGSLVLDGDSSAFAGTTDVQAGTLIVGGSAGNGAALGGDVSVAAGATLGGHGEIGGSVVNAGTLAPGASLGTLTIHGDYTQAADGILQVEVTPDGRSDLLVVDGSASLAGGTVVLASAGDWKPRTDYTILTAGGGVGGTFDSASSNFVFLDVVLDYAADNVLFSLQRNDVAFSSFTGTRNQSATANGADTLGWGNAAYNALTMIGAEEAPQAFDALSGEIHASARTVLMNDSHYLRDAIGNRLLAASGNGGWISGWRHWMHGDGDGNAAALQGDGNGFAAGVDFAVGGNWRLGAVVGTERTGTDAGTRASSADIDSRHLGAYASIDAHGTLLQAGAVRSSHDIDTRRAVAFSGFSDSLRASYDARTTQAFVDASHAFTVGRGGIAPFLDLAWVRVHSDGFDEQGGDAALQVDAAGSERTSTTLGVRWNAALGSGDALRLHGSVGWSRVIGDDGVPVDSQRFLGGSGTFAVAGTPIDDGALALDAGLRWQVAPRITLDAGYVGRFAGDIRDQGARMAVQIAL